LDKGVFCIINNSILAAEMKTVIKVLQAINLNLKGCFGVELGHPYRLGIFFNNFQENHEVFPKVVETKNF